MTEIRGDVFRELDATALDEHDSYNIHIGETPEDVTSLSVVFREYDADSEEELERLLNERAEEVLEQSSVDRAENTGYEVVREYGDTYRKCGFVIVSSHL